MMMLFKFAEHAFMFLKKQVQNRSLRKRRFVFPLVSLFFWMLVVPADVCYAMIHEAQGRHQESLSGSSSSSASRVSRDANTEKWTTAVPGVAVRVLPFPITERMVAIYCVVVGHTLAQEGYVEEEDKNPSTALTASARVSWTAIDSKCFHARADLSMGIVRRSLGDIENLGSDPTGGLCVECPGHGFLFSLCTGDNLVPNAKFINKKMSIEGLKGVKGMQRPYLCTFDETVGLRVVDGGTQPRYACETKWEFLCGNRTKAHPFRSLVKCWIEFLRIWHCASAV